MLPEGSPLPVAEAGSRSFVEWARAVLVEKVGPGRYQVEVVVRRLGAREGGGYERVDPVGVLIDLTWTAEGWMVTDLPALVDAPLMPQDPGWPLNELPVSELPPAIESIASELGGQVVGGSQVGEAWRLVVVIADATGVSWPMVIWADLTGNRIPVPATPGQP